MLIGLLSDIMEFYREIGILHLAFEILEVFTTMMISVILVSSNSGATCSFQLQPVFDILSSFLKDLVILGHSKWPPG